LLVLTNRQLRLEIDSLKTRLSASKTASFNAGVAAVAGSGISDLENSANLENSTGSFIGSSTNAATASRTDQVRIPTFHILVPKLLFIWVLHCVQSSAKLLREISDLRKINAQLEAEINRLKDEAMIQMNRHREEVRLLAGISCWMV
jgi:cell division septum initiation protein DivIVA